MNAPKMENVDRLATCKRCGDGMVAWKEAKSGKPMLLDAHLSNGRTFRVKAHAPYEFHVCIPKATPASIDGKLSELWAELQQARFTLADHRARVRAIENGTAKSYELSRREYHEQQVDDLVRWIGRLELLTHPLEEEYVLRGKWNRYFLVKNAGGHVHRGMNCSTCFDTTRYAWLVDLADCDEEKMVDEYGTMACTICFPDAPTLPGWARYAQREASAAAEFCTGSGTFEVDDIGGSLRLYRPRGRCRVCGDVVSVTSTGKMRKHKPPVRENEEARS